MVTEAPADPLVGLNDVIVGPVVTVKLAELVAVPAGLVTEIFPVVAPVGTVAVILVEESTVNFAADVPLNFTPVAPVKFVPLIVTEVPTGPLVGLNEPMVGAAAPVTLKFVELVAVPSGVVTVIGPVVAPAGTAAVIFVEELIVKTAAVPLNFPGVAQVKLVPLIVTDVPGRPVVGLNEVIFGVTVKLEPLVAVPPGVVSAMAPVVAAAETVAVIFAEHADPMLERERVRNGRWLAAVRALNGAALLSNDVGSPSNGCDEGLMSVAPFDLVADAQFTHYDL